VTCCSTIFFNVVAASAVADVGMRTRANGLSSDTVPLQLAPPASVTVISRSVPVATVSSAATFTDSRP